MALTDLKSKTAKPKAKPYKLFDAEGLYILNRNLGQPRIYQSF